MHTIVPPAIRTLPLFSGLAEQEICTLIQTGHNRQLGNGEKLFVHGDPIKSFFILCDGAIQTFRETPEGHEITADLLIPGDTLGDVEIFQSQPVHQFNAVAVKDSVVIEFPSAWLKESAKQHGTFALNLLAKLSGRARVASIEAEHKSTMSAAQQVACFLERLCVLHDFNPNGFDLPYSKTLIASRLGMELETFSRALAKIREHGVSVIGTRVSFHDIEKLGNYVCSTCSIVGNCDEHEVLKERLNKDPSEQYTVSK